MLTDQQVEEFRKIYKDKFHEEISDEEIHKQGIQLISLVRLIYKPIPRPKD